MDVEFDPAKDEENRRKHGLSLADAADLDMVAVIPDDRENYGETRWRGFGWLDGRLHMLAFTIREDRVRAISFRRASKQEVKRYAQ